MDSQKVNDAIKMIVIVVYTTHGLYLEEIIAGQAKFPTEGAFTLDKGRSFKLR